MEASCFILHCESIFATLSLTCPPGSTRSASPVVVRVIPVVEVNQETVSDDISDGGDADESRVLPVDRLQLPPHMEATALRDRQVVRLNPQQTDRQVYTDCRQTGVY